MELHRQIAEWRLDLEQLPARRVHHRLAEALLAAGRPREALTVAEKGLALQPHYLACLDVKGQALLALNRWAEAVEAFRRLAERVDAAAVTRHLAIALLGAGDAGASRRLCEQLLQADPLDADAKKLMTLGSAALPPPVAEDRPLPTEAMPSAAPAAPTPPPMEPKTPLPPLSRPPVAPRQSVGASPTPAAIKPPAGRAPSPARSARKTPAPTAAGSNDGGASAAPDASLDSLTVAETERLVDDFFGDLVAPPSAAAAAPAAVRLATPPPAATPSPTPKPPTEPPPATAEVDSEEEEIYDPEPEAAVKAENAHEYDPTVDMNQDLDVSEVDVFGEVAAPPPAMAPDAPPSAAPAPPTPPKPEAPVVAWREEAPAESDESRLPADAEADFPTDQDNRAQKKRGFWKTWRSRKE